MNLPISPLPELVSQLLEPISAESPCGPDLRYEPEYDQLRELRREDDTSLPTGVWQSSIKRALWPDLERLATTLLLERSKDLMISAWLGRLGCIWPGWRVCRAAWRWWRGCVSAIRSSCTPG
ncbi:type VI secretion system ImpA family N-terminal domain-containing protein [Pseudomonas sp. NA13]